MTTYSIDLCEGGIASASSVLDGFFPENAFDNTGAGFSSGSSTFPQWLKYEFTEAKRIRRYTLTSFDSGWNEMMTSWELQGSNNNTDWVILDTRSGETGWVPQVATTRTYDFVNTNTYKYYKWNILANTGGLLWIGEIEMMEDLDFIVPPEPEVNPYVRPDNIKGLYNISLKAGIRNAAKNGFIRPTLAESFMTHKDFTPILSNKQPVANPDSVTMYENTSIIINLLANDTDPELQPMTITALAGVVHGSLTNHGNGTVTYTPVANYFGSDSFGYTIMDNKGGTSSSVCSITINEVPMYITPPGGSSTPVEGTKLQLNTFGEYLLTVSAETLVECKLWGAAGGRTGGNGGYTYGKTLLLPNTQYIIWVGQGGRPGPIIGSFGGGGNCGIINWGDGTGIASGGGLTGIFKSSVAANNSILIGGGGGGGDTNRRGGNGGGLTGGIGVNAGNGIGGGGGTQTAGGYVGAGGMNSGQQPGSSLQGGNAVSVITNSYSGGGGGGGYFGGGAGGANNVVGGMGGGGSSFIHPTLVTDGFTSRLAEGGGVVPNATDIDYINHAGDINITDVVNNYATGPGNNGLFVMTILN